MMPPNSGNVTLRDLNITGCVRASAVLIPIAQQAPTIQRSVIFRRVHFENNSAEGGERSSEGFADALSLGESGGAIRADTNTSVQVFDSSFVNQSSFQGGAIYAAGDLEVQGTSFIDCVATLSGGAIHANARGAALEPLPPLFLSPRGPTNRLRVEECEFVRNSALNGQEGTRPVTPDGLDVESFQFFTFEFPGLSGGAIVVRDVRIVEIVDSSFTENNGSAGGALQFSVNFHQFDLRTIQDVTYSVQGSTFTRNRANFGKPEINQGGAVFLSAPGGPFNMEFINSTFTGNQANFGGALLSVTDDGARTSIEGCTFEANQAATAGVAFPHQLRPRTPSLCS